jgi:hypothetical protein
VYDLPLPVLPTTTAWRWKEPVSVQEGPCILIQRVPAKIQLGAVAGHLRDDLHEICEALAFEGKAVGIDFGHSLKCALEDVLFQPFLVHERPNQSDPHQVVLGQHGFRVFLGPV